MKNVLVVGGAGFIGSHLVHRLLNTPDVEHVTVYDNFTTGKWAYLPTDHTKLRVVPGSINIDQLRYAMRGCDTVFHLAANADIAKAATRPDIDFWEGTFLTQCVLEAMRLEGVKRIIFTSGSGVYGDCGDTPVREDMPCFPISPYGAAKLASEALISSYCHMFGMEGRVFRFANVVGPRQTHGVTYDFIRKLRADPTRLEIMGDGSQSKSYIHVDDVIEAMLLATPTCQKQYDVWNVAASDYLKVIEIAWLTVFEMGLSKTGSMGEIAGPTFFYKGRRSWQGDVPVVRFDTSKIRALGWTPKHESMDAVILAIQAMLKECA